MSGEIEGLIFYCLIQLYTLLLSCQSESWLTVFSRPRGELAILNQHLNIEQVLEYLSFNPIASLEGQLKLKQEEEQKQRK